MKTVLSALLTLFALFVVMASIGYVQAASSGYYLSTSRMALQVHPGTHIATGVIKVSSQATEKIKLKVVPRAWALKSGGEIEYLPKTAAQAVLDDALNINPSEFELSPGKSRLVRFALKLPDTFHNQEFRFQLAFEPVGVKNFEPTVETSSATTGVHETINIVSVFTTTIYVTEGHPQPAPAVKSFTCALTPTARLNQVPRVNAHIALENTGEQHARLLGHLSLFKKSGTDQYELIKTVDVNTGRLILAMPGATRTFNEPVSLSDSLQPHDSLHNAYRLELRLVDERNEQPVVLGNCQF